MKKIALDDTELKHGFFEKFSSKKDFQIFRFFDKNCIEKKSKKCNYSDNFDTSLNSIGDVEFVSLFVLQN